MATIKSYVKEQLTTFRAKQAAADDLKYVAKVAGKGLSTEDFTTELKNKLEGLNTSELASVKSAVETLVGEDSSKSARAIAAEEVAKIVAGADASYDTLKEIADWILNDTTGAAKMASDIAALKSRNDYSDAEKQKVADAYTHSQAAHAPADAEKNVIAGIKLGTDALAPNDDRIVTIALDAFGDSDWNDVFGVSA